MLNAILSVSLFVTILMILFIAFVSILHIVCVMVTNVFGWFRKLVGIFHAKPY